MFSIFFHLFACCFESQAKSFPWDATEAVAHGLASHEGQEPVSSCKWKEESLWISTIVVHIFHPGFWCLPGLTSKIQEALDKTRVISVDVSRLSCLKRALVAWKPQAARNGGNIFWSRTLSYRPQIRFTMVHIQCEYRLASASRETHSDIVVT